MKLSELIKRKSPLFTKIKYSEILVINLLI